MVEARLYQKLEEGKVQCNLCAHRCRISPGKLGICGVRENRAGTLYTLVYGKAISQAVDPVEKKPLFHFYPGTTAFSIATVGCNFRCQFCQNWEISQMPREENRIIGGNIPPETIVRNAKRYGSRSIAYTYTEPTIFFEYAYDIAVLAHEEGIANIYVTNGYMTPEMLEAFHPYLDAANVDLKAGKDEFYRQYCGARLQPVMDALKKMKSMGIWVEVTTLIIPGLNDSEDELRFIADFIVKELGPETPWHVSRFHPQYRMLDRPPTPVATLRKAREIGLKAGLRYVYEGNVPGSEGENTYCYSCGRLLIRRFGFSILEYRITNGHCYNCGAIIDGVGL
ncbi:MAG: AmmeMemoRadiSam system radical SAM enzyme [Anaerolineae bacterium]|nr:AmmeMemoRadiSam system radical SAM enzyme [Anaerolineae bacterium]MDW8102117.1 AmmeMemoRadiSam system radical SAM enzyme [Anaerolineae bacterium]